MYPIAHDTIAIASNTLNSFFMIILIKLLNYSKYLVNVYSLLVINYHLSWYIL